MRLNFLAVVELQMVDYMARQAVEQGTPWPSIARYMLGLRHGLPGSRRWRRVWSDHKLKTLHPRDVMALAHAPAQQGKGSPRWSAPRSLMPEALQRETRIALLLLWLVPALWAVNYIVARKAPGVIGPYALALGRWSLAALILLVITRRELWRERESVICAWRQHLALGTLGMLICGAWVYEGARSTEAMNIALIYSASPVLISLGAMWWLGEAFGARQKLGVALALAGVVHVVVKGNWTALADVQFVAGDAWILAATVSWAAYALLQKRWPSPLRDCPPGRDLCRRKPGFVASHGVGAVPACGRCAG